ncbi:MAG: STAS domain-containing protein [Solirubrobacterales bacterium]
MITKQQRDVADGTLAVRAHLNGSAQVISFSGELDLANAATAELELSAAMASDSQVVVDLRELEFIDSTGIALLIAALGRCEEGRELRFVPSQSAAVNRVLALTGVAARLPLLDGGLDD